MPLAVGAADMAAAGRPISLSAKDHNRGGRPRTDWTHGWQRKAGLDLVFQPGIRGLSLDTVRAPRTGRRCGRQRVSALFQHQVSWALLALALAAPLAALLALLALLTLLALLSLLTLLRLAAALVLRARLA